DDFAQALQGLMPWRLRRRLDAEAPTHFTAPSGSAVPIDYEAQEGPKLAIRVQELFGLDRHPSVAAGRVPPAGAPLSPARRAGEGDARSARFLARQLRGGQSRDEGPLPAPSLARQSARCRAHAPRQAALVLMRNCASVLWISMPGGGSANCDSGYSTSHGAAA